MRTHLAPELPAGRIVVEPPPPLEPDEGVTGVLTSAVPMLGSLGSVALVATMTTQSGSGHRSLVAAAMFVLGTLGFVVVQVDRQRHRRTHQVARARTGYLRHLADVRDRARRAADEQRAALDWHHPPPGALPALAAERSRVWTRTAEREHFLEVRYAVAARPLAVELVPPEPSADEPDPVAAAAVRRLLATHRRTPDLPLTLDLRQESRVQVRGSLGRARSLARAVVCAAATSHSPADLTVAVVTAPDRLGHWEWLKWLPHALSPSAHDAAGPRRLVVTSTSELLELLSEPPDGHVLLVADRPATGGTMPTRWCATTVLELAGPTSDPTDDAAAALVLDVGLADQPLLRVTRRHEEPLGATADQCDQATAEAVARRLLPMATPSHSGGGNRTASALELWGHRGDSELDPAAAWSCAERRRLRVALGATEEGEPVHLDLEEAARGGMGPHGLMIGATGSGKSELLRTLVLGLALAHPPDELNVVLVDFKGGATFAGLARLPHVAALVTNLADDLALVDRMQDALVGELVRRQQLLRAAGDLASIHEHQRAREAGADLPVLPPLLVVVDEFSELLSARPDFADLFTAIGRLGRSLGLHLLVASQRLDEGRLRGLESHLSYRIGLRTFSASESRAVLGTPDAAELPPVPGLGLLRAGSAPPVRFRAAHVSGAPPAPSREESARVLPFTLGEVRPPPAPTPAPTPSGPRSVLEAAVDRLAGAGPRARQVWLPPLDVPDPLGRLLGGAVTDPVLGFVATRWRGRPLCVPVGTVDRPREQRREPLLVDLSGAGGHVAVVGAPRSGRSTLLLTLVTALALTHTPREVQFFVIDVAGGGLASLAGLPHTCGVAGRAEHDVVRRIIGEVGDLLDRREAWFAEHGIDSLATYRRLQRDGDPGDGYGEVFLVIDGWAALRAGHDELEADVHQIASRGLTLGVHVVTATGRWADFRASTRDLVGTRLELRLGDPLDSEIDRRTARLVPHDRPGRGLTLDGRHFLAALPRIDGDSDPQSVGSGVADLVARVAAAWPGAPAPRLRLLPSHVSLAQVHRSHDRSDDRLALGLDERLDLLTLDPASDPHLLVLGGRGSGRTATLRTVLRQLVRRLAPEQAQVVLVDPRRSLLAEVPDDHLLGHHPTDAGPALRELADHLRLRLPGPGVSAEQLRSRSWWTGAEAWVVVDDHDLLTTGGARSPLAELIELLPHAGDVGLHLVVARHSGGAARALLEPVFQTLRDLATPVLLLPGSPGDGPVVGRVAPRSGPPGRAQLVEQSGVRTVQVAWAEPTG